MASDLAAREAGDAAADVWERGIAARGEMSSYLWRFLETHVDAALGEPVEWIQAFLCRLPNDIRGDVIESIHNVASAERHELICIRSYCGGEQYVRPLSFSKHAHEAAQAWSRAELTRWFGRRVGILRPMKTWAQMTDTWFEEWTTEYSDKEAGFVFKNTEGSEKPWGWAILRFKASVWGEATQSVEKRLASGNEDARESAQRACDLAYEERNL